MTPRTRTSDVRIAIAGRYLDEVRIRQTRSYEPGCVSYLSFPASRHWVRVEGDCITVSAQAATVVQLFADGALPPIGAGAVPLKVAGRDVGPCRLESVESGETSAVDDMIVLRFRQASEGQP